MPDTTPTPNRSPGQTSGSEERPPREIEASTAVDLTREVETLRREAAVRAG
jgi:hypothetical protein